MSSTRRGLDTCVILKIKYIRTSLDVLYKKKDFMSFFYVFIFIFLCSLRYVLYINIFVLLKKNIFGMFFYRCLFLFLLYSLKIKEERKERTLRVLKKRKQTGVATLVGLVPTTTIAFKPL